MATVTFRGCTGCGACLLTCPTHAIRPAGRNPLAAARELTVCPLRCTGCGECVEVCPSDAITLHTTQDRE
jgi:ferredoxin